VYRFLEVWKMAKPRKKSAIAASGQSREILHVAAYLRVSTEMQVRSGLGLGDQRRQVEMMAQLKSWPAPTVYVDEGISGAKESRQRPALLAMMQAVAAGEIDAIIINSIDRLSRRARVSLELSDEMGRYGVRLVSVKESFDTETPSGRMIFGFMAMLAEYERELIRERTRAALAEHSRRDGESGGRLPYGYVRELDGLRIERAWSRIIRRIFLWRSEGLTLRAIAAQLNKRRYASPQGKHWHHSSVAAVLANEVYYRGGLRGASSLHWPVILKDEQHGEDNQP
jgi:site-specific DNA recombinase